MSQNRDVLAVIMARAGSVGLPGKSIIDLLGKPVIAYTFDHVRASKLITRTVVSSDDPTVLALARDAGFETIQRPAELATSTSATDPVLRHAVRSLYPEIENQKSKIENPSCVVMLYGNVPVRLGGMIDSCIEMLFKTGCDSVQTIAPVGKMHPYWMFDCAGDGRIKKHIPNNIFRRQELPELFAPTGAVYVTRSEVLMSSENSPDPHAFLGADRRGLVVSPEDSVDIDAKRDLFLAEAVLRSMKGQG